MKLSEMNDEELEQFSAQLKLRQLPKRMRRIREQKAIEGFKQRPHQSELKNALFLLEDIVSVYERYSEVNYEPSEIVMEILENTIKGICNYIANDF